MAVAVNQPRQRAKDEDPLDTIIKGLSIASTVYGIKEAGDKRTLLEQQYADSKAQQETENAFKQRELDIKQAELNRPRVQDPTQSEYKQFQLAEAKRKAEEAAEKSAFEKTPEGRLAKLPSSDRQRLDNAKLGMISVQGMADALQKGDNTFSLVGDNDFTQQRTLFEEALGRMQSGGAITKEEEMRFKSMAPTMWDSKDMQQKKLQQLQAEMSGRLGTLGFQPEELGIAARPNPSGAPVAAGVTPEEARQELIRRQGLSSVVKGKPGRN